MRLAGAIHAATQRCLIHKAADQASRERTETGESEKTKTKNKKKEDQNPWPNLFGRALRGSNTTTPDNTEIYADEAFLIQPRTWGIFSGV